MRGFWGNRAAGLTAEVADVPGAKVAGVLDGAHVRSGDDPCGLGRALEIRAVDRQPAHPVKLLDHVVSFGHAVLVERDIRPPAGLAGSVECGLTVTDEVHRRSILHSFLLAEKLKSPAVTRGSLGAFRRRLPGDCTEVL